MSVGIEQGVEVDLSFKGALRPQKEKSKRRSTVSSTAVAEPEFASYMIIGPESLFAGLDESVRQIIRTCHGRVSPLANVAPSEVADGAGVPKSKEVPDVPQSAVYYAYLYPLHHATQVDSALYSIETPWSGLILAGGFAYFDKNAAVLQVDVFATPESMKKLHLSGPHPVTSSRAVDALRLQGRIRPATAPRLKDSGVVSLAWIHANEQPTQNSLTEDTQYIYAHMHMHMHMHISSIASGRLPWAWAWA